MDIFWVLDPDPHNNRCGSATLVSGTGIHLGLILFRRISLSKSTFFRVVKRHFIEVLFLLGFFYRTAIPSLLSVCLCKGTLIVLPLSGPFIWPVGTVYCTPGVCSSSRRKQRC